MVNCFCRATLGFYFYFLNLFLESLISLVGFEGYFEFEESLDIPLKCLVGVIELMHRMI